MFRNHWVRWGFGERLGPPGEGEFTIDYRGAQPHPRLTSPLEIAAEAAAELCASFGPHAVLVSGGVDSQAMAFAFKAAGAAVRYVMVRYNGGLNDHDIKTAEAFYARHRIPVEVLDIDILAFHETELVTWARRFDCTSPHLLSHMKIAATVGGPVAFAGTPVTPDGELGRLTYETFALERYGAISGQSVVGYFFTYDPHVHASFRGIPAATDGSIAPDYHRKCLLYQQAGFPVDPQPDKLHGFEKIKEHYDDRDVPGPIRLRFISKPSPRPYDLLFRYPLEDELRKIKMTGARILY